LGKEIDLDLTNNEKETALVNFTFILKTNNLLTKKIYILKIK